MYKYVFRVHQVLYRQKQLDKVNFHSSGCFKSNVEKIPKSNGCCKSKKIQKKKQLISSRKRTVVYFYTVLWNGLLNPLVELVPGVKKLHNLSKLSDFRTHNGFLGKTECENKVEGKVYSKCLEEPKKINTKKQLEIEDCVIKNPFDVVESKSTNPKGSVKIWDLKSKNNKGKYKAINKPQSRAKSIFYKLLVKRFVDPKIESFIPSENQLSELCDFRSYKEGHVECDINEMQSSNSRVKHQLTDSGFESKTVKPIIEKTHFLKTAHVQNTSKSTHSTGNTKTANKVREKNSRFNRNNVAKTTGEMKKTDKKFESQKIAIVKAPNKDKIQPKKKLPLRVGPPLPKAEQKVETKDVASNKLQGFSGNRKREQEVNETIIVGKTDDHGNPVNTYDPTKNDVAKDHQSDESQRKVLARQLGEEENISTSKHPDVNNSLSKNQEKVIETSQDGTNKSYMDNHDLEADANLTLQEHSERIGRHHEQNKLNPLKLNKLNSNNKLKANNEKKANNASSDTSNGNILSKSSNVIEISEEKEKNSSLNVKESVNSTESLPYIQDNLNVQLKTNEAQAEDESIRKSKYKVIKKELTNKNNKYFNSYKKFPRTSRSGSTSKSRTHKLQNVIDSKLKDYKKFKKSADKSVKEKSSRLGLNATQLVSLDKSGEGCVVKTNNSLINLIDVVASESNSKEKSKLNITGNLQKSQNNISTEKGLLKSSRSGKEELEAKNYIKDIKTVKNNGATVHLGNNVIAEEKTNNELFVNNSKRLVSSSSSSNINIKSNKSPSLKTVPLESVELKDTVESISKSNKLNSLELKPKSSKMTVMNSNQSLKTSLKNEIGQKSELKNDKISGMDMNKPENFQKDKTVAKIKVLRGIKREQIVELKKKDNIKQQQNKEKVLDETKLNVVVKEKTKYTLNDVEKNKQTSNNAIKNTKSLKNNFKSENIGTDCNIKAKNSKTAKTTKESSSDVLKRNTDGMGQREEETSILDNRRLQRSTNSLQNKENNNFLTKNPTDIPLGSYSKSAMRRSEVKESKESMSKEKGTKFTSNTQQKSENKLDLNSKTQLKNRSKSLTKDVERISELEKTNANSNTPINNLQKALSISDMKSCNEENVKYFTDTENDSFRKKVNSIAQENNEKRLLKSNITEKRGNSIDNEQLKPKMSELSSDQSTTGPKGRTETENTKAKNLEIRKQESNLSGGEAISKEKKVSKPPVRKR